MFFVINIHFLTKNDSLFAFYSFFQQGKADFFMKNGFF